VVSEGCVGAKFKEREESEDKRRSMFECLKGASSPAPVGEWSSFKYKSE